MRLVLNVIIESERTGLKNCTYTQSRTSSPISNKNGLSTTSLFNGSIYTKDGWDVWTNFRFNKKSFFSWSANPSVYKYGQTNGLSVQTNYLRSSSAKTNLADSSSGRTETNINTWRVVCIVAGLTKCQQERQQSLGWRGRPAPGVFVPECDTNGEYKSTQCHESSGLCWCVDAGGNEVPRTRIRGRAICRPSGKLSN